MVILLFYCHHRGSLFQEPTRLLRYLVSVLASIEVDTLGRCFGGNVYPCRRSLCRIGLDRGISRALRDYKRDPSKSIDERTFSNSYSR